MTKAQMNRIDKQASKVGTAMSQLQAVLYEVGDSVYIADKIESQGLTGLGDTISNLRAAVYSLIYKAGVVHG